MSFYIKIAIPLIAILLLESCHVGRSIFRYKAEITDHKFFPYDEVKKSDEPFSFFEAQQKINPRLSIDKQPKVDLTKILEEQTTTTAFLMIQGDSIIYEHYFRGYKHDDVSMIFSVSKSITSLLIGIAIDEGLIKSIQDPVTDYIPELRDAHPYFKELTIEHCLDMRSGLKFNEAYVNPFSHVARLYYGTNQMRLVKGLSFDHKPGEVHRYISIATTVLGLVLENVIDVELATYLQEKVWKPLGMEYDAKWSLDDKKHRSAKAFCGISTTAKDLAKIGRLYLNNGNWDGHQIVSESWITKSISPKLENDCYQYQWYNISGNKMTFPDSLSAQADALEHDYAVYKIDQGTTGEKNWHVHYCEDDYYAAGILSQFLYVDPEKDIIMVRLGEKWDDDMPYVKIFRAIASSF